LGYYEFITIEKTRSIYKIKDMEVCLDEVKDLGSYIELEKFAPGNETLKVQDELRDLLKLFEVDEKDHTCDGYDILLSNLKKIKI